MESRSQERVEFDLYLTGIETMLRMIQTTVALLALLFAPAATHALPPYSAPPADPKTLDLGALEKHITEGPTATTKPSDSYENRAADIQRMQSFTPNGFLYPEWAGRILRRVPEDQKAKWEKLLSPGWDALTKRDEIVWKMEKELLDPIDLLAYQKDIRTQKDYDSFAQPFRALWDNPCKTDEEKKAYAQGVLRIVHDKNVDPFFTRLPEKLIIRGLEKGVTFQDLFGSGMTLRYEPRKERKDTEEKGTLVFNFSKGKFLKDGKLLPQDLEVRSEGSPDYGGFFGRNYHGGKPVIVWYCIGSFEIEEGTFIRLYCFKEDGSYEEVRLTVAK